MCLAIPMRVVSLQTEAGFDEPSVALAESGGVEKAVRLDMVDRIPEVGEYVVVHAGFAVHSLSAEEAERNIALLRDMAANLEREGRLPEAF